MKRCDERERGGVPLPASLLVISWWSPRRPTSPLQLLPLLLLLLMLLSRVAGSFMPCDSIENAPTTTTVGVTIPLSDQDSEYTALLSYEHCVWIDVNINFKTTRNLQQLSLDFFNVTLLHGSLWISAASTLRNLTISVRQSLFLADTAKSGVSVFARASELGSPGPVLFAVLSVASLSWVNVTLVHSSIIARIPESAAASLLTVGVLELGSSQGAAAVLSGALISVHNCTIGAEAFNRTQKAAARVLSVTGFSNVNNWHVVVADSIVVVNTTTFSPQVPGVARMLWSAAQLNGVEVVIRNSSLMASDLSGVTSALTWTSTAVLRNIRVSIEAGSVLILRSIGDVAMLTFQAPNAAASSHVNATYAITDGSVLDLEAGSDVVFFAQSAGGDSATHRLTNVSFVLHHSSLRVVSSGKSGGGGVAAALSFPLEARASTLIVTGFHVAVSDSALLTISGHVTSLMNFVSPSLDALALISLEDVSLVVSDRSRAVVKGILSASFVAAHAKGTGTSGSPTVAMLRVRVELDTQSTALVSGTNPSFAYVHTNAIRGGFNVSLTDVTWALRNGSSLVVNSTAGSPGSVADVMSIRTMGSEGGGSFTYQSFCMIVDFDSLLHVESDAVSAAVHVMASSRESATFDESIAQTISNSSIQLSRRSTLRVLSAQWARVMQFGVQRAGRLTLGVNGLRLAVVDHSTLTVLFLRSASVLCLYAQAKAFNADVDYIRDVQVSVDQGSQFHMASRSDSTWSATAILESTAIDVCVASICVVYDATYVANAAIVLTNATLMLASGSQLNVDVARMAAVLSFYAFGSPWNARITVADSFIGVVRNASLQIAASRLSITSKLSDSVVASIFIISSALTTVIRGTVIAVGGAGTLATIVGRHLVVGSIVSGGVGRGALSVTGCIIATDSRAESEAASQPEVDSKPSSWHAASGFTLSASASVELLSVVSRTADVQDASEAHSVSILTRRVDVRISTIQLATGPNVAVVASLLWKREVPAGTNLIATSHCVVFTRDVTIVVSLNSYWMFLGSVMWWSTASAGIIQGRLSACSCHVSNADMNITTTHVAIANLSPMTTANALWVPQLANFAVTSGTPTVNDSWIGASLRQSAIMLTVAQAVVASITVPTDDRTLITLEMVLENVTMTTTAAAVVAVGRAELFRRSSTTFVSTDGVSSFNIFVTRFQLSIAAPARSGSNMFKVAMRTATTQRLPKVSVTMCQTTLMGADAALILDITLVNSGVVTPYVLPNDNFRVRFSDINVSGATCFNVAPIARRDNGTSSSSAAGIVPPVAMSMLNTSLQCGTVGWIQSSMGTKGLVADRVVAYNASVTLTPAGGLPASAASWVTTINDLTAFDVLLSNSPSLLDDGMWGTLDCPVPDLPVLRRSSDLSVNGTRAAFDRVPRSVQVDGTAAIVTMAHTLPNSTATATINGATSTMTTTSATDVESPPTSSSPPSDPPSSPPGSDHVSQAHAGGGTTTDISKANRTTVSEDRTPLADLSETRSVSVPALNATTVVSIFVVTNATLSSIAGPTLETAAQVSVSSSSAAQGISSALLSPFRANKGTSLSRAVRLMQCSPSQPPETSWELYVWDGEGSLVWAVLATMLTHLLFFVGCLSGVANRVHPTVVKVLTAIYGVMCVYYAPNVATGGTYLLFAATSTRDRLVGLSGGLVVATSCASAMVAAVKHRSRAAGSSISSAGPNGNGTMSLVDAIGACHAIFFEGVDSAVVTSPIPSSSGPPPPPSVTPVPVGRRWPLLAHAFVAFDMINAVIIGCLSAMPAALGKGCLSFAVAMAALSVGQLAYLSVVRPFVSRYDNVAAGGLLLVNSVVFVACAAVAARTAPGGQPSPGDLGIVAHLSLAASSAYFCELVVSATFAVREWWVGRAAVLPPAAHLTRRANGLAETDPHELTTITATTQQRSNDATPSQSPP